MATWWLAGRNVDASCWAILEPRPVTAKESSQSSQPRSEVQAKLASSSQSSQLGLSLRAMGLSLRAMGLSPCTMALSLRTMGLSLRTMGLSLHTMGLSKRTMGRSPRTMGLLLRSLGLSLHTMGVLLRTLGLSLRTMGLSLDTMELSFCQLVRTKFCDQKYDIRNPRFEITIPVSRLCKTTRPWYQETIPWYEVTVPVTMHLFEYQFHAS